MTSTASADTEQAAADSPVRARLRAAAGNRRTTTRKTTPRKATPRAAPSRAARAAAKGKYAPRFAPLVKSGAAIVAMRNPVAARVIQLRADPLFDALDAVAAEDSRVDALLSRLSALFGKGGAWGRLGQETAVMGAGLLLATGMTPTGAAGVMLTMFAGGIVSAATYDVALQAAAKEAQMSGRVDSAGNPIVDPARVEQLVDQLMSEQEAKRTARAEQAAAADVVDDDQDHADTPEPETKSERFRESVFSAWAR